MQKKLLRKSIPNLRKLGLARIGEPYKIETDIASLIETCKLYAVRPHKHAHEANLWPASRNDQLRPWA